VIVIPEWNDPNRPAQFHYIDQFGAERCAGAVKLILIDQNGMPANTQIINAVYSHIMGSGETDVARLAPIGAHLTVVAPTGVEIDITATVILDTGEDIGTVTTRFMTGLTDYWLEAAQEAQESAGGNGYVRYAQVGAVLAKTQGVVDYTGLTINGATANIAITQEEYPVTGEVNLSG
jgi:uncharacterized phage protein gp47/JayE